MPILRRAALVLALVCGPSVVCGDTFTYDNANRLQSAAQSNGLSHSYAPDAESNLLSVSHGGTDTTDSGGAGNGIPDWWENYYFGVRGVDPLASPASDGLSNLLKYTLGLNPLVHATGQAATVTFQTYSGDGMTYPYVTFIRAKDAASALTLEQSSDGVNWVSGSAYLQQVSAQDLGNGTEQVVMRSLTPLPAGAQLYFRLEASGVAGVTSDYSVPPGSQGVPALPLWAWGCLAVILPFIASRQLRRTAATR